MEIRIRELSQDMAQYFDPQLALLFSAGHSKAVNTVCWSHNKQWFLSTSEDPTLCIWTTSASEPVLTMVTYQQFNQIQSLH